MLLGFVQKCFKKVKQFAEKFKMLTNVQKCKNAKKCLKSKKRKEFSTKNQKCSKKIKMFKSKKVENTKCKKAANTSSKLCTDVGPNAFRAECRRRKARRALPTCTWVKLP